MPICKLLQQDADRRWKGELWYELTEKPKHVQLQLNIIFRFEKSCYSLATREQTSFHPVNYSSRDTKLNARRDQQKPWASHQSVSPACQKFQILSPTKERETLKFQTTQTIHDEKGAQRPKNMHRPLNIRCKKQFLPWRKAILELGVKELP